MRVQFIYSQEDLVDASLRIMRRSTSVRSTRRNTTIYYAAMAFGVVVLIFRYSIWGLLGAAILSALLLLVLQLSYENQARKNLRKFVKEQHGSDDQFTCEVELRPDALITTSEGCQHQREWDKVEEIVSTHDSVDIFVRGGGVIVRNRAFASAEERARFIDLAQQYKNNYIQ